MRIIADIPDNILNIINDNNGSIISSEHLTILLKSIMDGAAYFDRPNYVIKVNTAFEAQAIADELKRQAELGVILPNEYEIERLDRPHGKWIYRQEYDYEYWKCSNCGEPWELIEGTPKNNNMNFCPNCGAQMSEEGQV